MSYLSSSFKIAHAHSIDSLKKLVDDFLNEEVNQMSIAYGKQADDVIEDIREKSLDFAPQIVAVTDAFALLYNSDITKEYDTELKTTEGMSALDALVAEANALLEEAFMELLTERLEGLEDLILNNVIPELKDNNTSCILFTNDCGLFELNDSFSFTIQTNQIAA